MGQNQKKYWISWTMVFLIAVLNVSVITAAYTYNSNLFRALIVSIPLLTIAVYSAWPASRVRGKRGNRNQQSVVAQTLFNGWPHSVQPDGIKESDLQIVIGNDQCRKPYRASIFNIRLVAKSISTDVEKKITGSYALREGDIVWQIAPGFLGCRPEQGNFDSKAFRQLAGRPEVKMVELVLPSANKFSNLIQPSGHPAFTSAEGMLHLLGNLRELSGGKPVGIRLRINNKKQLHKICYAIRKTELIPDFIVVEGPVKRITAIHPEEVYSGDIPLYEALLFVSQTLQTYALDKKIKVIAAGDIISGFDILKMIALGADAVCSQFTGSTIIQYRSKAGKQTHLFSDQKVTDFRKMIMADAIQIMQAFSFRNVRDVTVSNVFRKLNMLNTNFFEAPGDPALYGGRKKSHQFSPQLSSN